MTDRESDPCRPWDDPTWRITSDSSRVARYRGHQGWFRQSQLGVEAAGIGVNGQPVVSMLPADAVAEAPHLNFITPAAFAHAEDRIAIAAAGNLTLDPDRLRRNMLSSMPLCINIFGSLGTHPAFLQLVQTLFDQRAAEVLEVVCEWAPQPPAKYLNDRSAFDAFVTYLDADDHRCFLGIETKYTEPFSPKEYRSAIYTKVTDASGWFRALSADELSERTSNQLWRTTMLAAKVEQLDDFHRGRVVVLSLDDDIGATIAVRAIHVHLVDPERVVHITYEQLVGSAARAGDPEIQEWAERFRLRYLPPIAGASSIGSSHQGVDFSQAIDRDFPAVLDVAPNVIESLSWGVAAAFVDRHPEFVVTEEHPADGTYDCLVLRARGADEWTADSIQLNRHGSGHIFRDGQHTWSWRGMWAEIASTFDFEFAARVLGHHLGIGGGGLRMSPPAISRGPRLVAALLHSHLGGRSTWSCVEAYRGSSFDGVLSPHWVPRAWERCWLITRDDVPQLAVDMVAACYVTSTGHVASIEELDVLNPHALVT